MKSNDYITRNAPTVAEMAIKNALWGKSTPEETFSQIASDAYIVGIDYRGLANEAQKIFYKAVESEKELVSFARLRREKLISPATSSANDYIKKIWETDMRISDIVRYLKSF